MSETVYYEEEYFYGEDDSRDSRCGGKNAVFVHDRPRPHSHSKGSKHKRWQKAVVDHVSEQINSDKLNRIDSGMRCNLYVTFYISREGRDELPDIDNLLKSTLDPLGKKYGAKSAPQPGAGLVEDDRDIRGIKAERELVASKDDEGAEIKYLLTKEFKIVGVIPVTMEDYLNSFRGYWRNPVNLVRAREIIGEEESREYRFIDNAPGNVFFGEHSDKIKSDAIPGYDWKSKEGQRVEGCMVFHRWHEKMAGDEDKHEKFWWINKW